MINLTPNSYVGYFVLLQVTNLVRGLAHSAPCLRFALPLASSSSKRDAVCLTPCFQSGNSGLLPPATAKSPPTSDLAKPGKSCFATICATSNWSSSQVGINLAMWLCYHQQPQYICVSYIERAFPDPRPDPLRAKNAILFQN